MNVDLINDTSDYSPIDQLVGMYEQGLRHKNRIKSTLTLRLNNRSFEVCLFGSTEGYRPYIFDSNMGGQSCNELYAGWRKEVIKALKNSRIAKHLPLKFMNTPEVLLEEQQYGHYPREEQQKIALETFSSTLDSLLQIISTIPAPKAQDNTVYQNAVVVTIGNFQVLEDGTIARAGKIIELKPQQRKLAKGLIEAKGRALSRQTIIDLLWNEEDGSEKYLDNPGNETKITKRISNAVSDLNTALRTPDDRKKHITKTRSGVASYKFVP